MRLPSRITFQNQKVVKIDRDLSIGHLEVLRDGEYIQMINEPSLEDNTLVYEFNKPETGRIF